jgi:hypothetical protein
MELRIIKTATDLYPLFVSILFMLTTLLTVFLFYKAAGEKKIVLAVLLLWLALQAVVSLTGFYLDTTTVPPRFIFLVLPPVLFILFLFATKSGRRFLDAMSLSQLTLLHTIRIPVEIVLFFLALAKLVPELMTFAGRNFDILSGITAPLIWYFGFRQKKLNSRVLLAWNIICLALLFNIVIHAILSAPFPFQQLAFDQPNTAVLYFPFVWLPSCVVPIVLLSHLASIRQLLKNKF